MFNLAWATLKLEQHLGARRLFVEYQRTAGRELTPALERRVEQAFAEIDSRIVRLRINASESEAILWIDEEKVGSSPLGDMVRVAPGRHRLRAEKGLHRAEVDVMATAGEQHTVLLQLAEPGVAPASVPLVQSRSAESPRFVEAATSWYKRWWLWGGAAAIVTGGVITAIVLSSRSEETERQDAFSLPLP